MNIVLYTQRVEIVEAYGERRDCADQRICQFIQACGYVPVPLPNDVDIVRYLINQFSTWLSGIILTGGNSLVKYGGNAPERDQTDRGVIELAVKEKIPLYGFCRGMQSILDYFGNDLVNVDGHVAVRHIIQGRETCCEVNSFHNQGCVKIKNSDLFAEMLSEDGVVEMIRHRNCPILGTMWHPEREEIFSEWDIQNVQELFG